MKKTKSRSPKWLVCLLVSVCLACTFLALYAGAEEGSVGHSFTASTYYDVKNELKSDRYYTIQTEIWIDPAADDSAKGGVIFGNFEHSTATNRCFTMYLVTGGYVQLYTQNGNGYTQVKFGNIDIKDYAGGTVDSPEFAKLSMCFDSHEGTATLTVSGQGKETSQTISHNNWKDPTLLGNYDHPHRVGGDYRGSNSQYFKGLMKNISVYSDVRSAEEISAYFTSETFSPDSTDDSLMIAYDLTKIETEGLLADLSKNRNNAVNPNVFHGGFTVDRYVDESTTSNYPEAYYETTKKVDEFPQTLEAWVFVPTHMSSARVGVIMGNYSGFGDNDAHLNFEVYTNRVPRIQWYDHYGNAKYDLKFTNSAIPTGQWTHLALIYDNGTGIASCYLNGELSESLYFYPSLDARVIDYPYVLAGDNRNLNVEYFKGALGDVTMYSDVRSAEEILEDYNKGMKMTKAEADLDNALCYYDLDDSDVYTNIKDDSGNGRDITYSKTWLDEADMEKIRESYGFDPSYSFAVIGDTQYTTKKFPSNLPTLYKWIVNNKENKNIQYAIGLGDITDVNGTGSERYTFVEDPTDELAGGYWIVDSSGEGTEWEVAAHAIRIMNGNLEYSLIRGNHDLRGSGNGFNEKFATDSAYTDQFIEYGGIYGYDGSGEITDVSNTWRTLRVGKVDYIIMNLDFGANDDILAWAAEIIDREEFKDHKVIVSTHGYLYSDNTTIDASDASAPTNVSASNNNGDDMWYEFASKHANIQLVLCGHIYSNKLPYNQVKGDFGNTVNEILVDPQVFDNTLGGVGVVAMFYFSEDGEKLAIEYYSTVRDKYFKTLNQITLDLSAEGEERAPEGWDGTQEAPLGSGTESDPYLISNAGNLLWMAKQIKNTNKPTFDGAYFLQTADIDLCGMSIKSIGYYFKSETEMAAFGGHYDGNGYSIKNGTVNVNASSYAFNCYYGYGLFGAIFGAVIEDVTLDNVQILGIGVTGGIVGIAASPLVSDTVYEEFNVISGCEIKNNVRFVAALPTGSKTGANFDNNARGGRIGTVVGLAHGTLIEGCASEASFTFTADFGICGGIAGSIGLNSTVRSCSYSGNMTLYDDAVSQKQTCVYGGIVGAISPSTQWKATYSGYAHIYNCYNEGDFFFDGVIAKNGKFVKNTHWGGILGSGCWLPYIEATEERPYPYLIENCYNLSDGPERLVTSNVQVIAGIAAKTLVTADTTSSLAVKNCYSVAVLASSDNGNNEFRYNDTKLGKEGQLGAYLVGDGGTLSADMMGQYAIRIDKAIKNIRNGEATVSWYGGAGIPTADAEVGTKYFDSAAATYYVYGTDGWTFGGGIGNYTVTGYGIIPGAYEDTASYPFALFMASKSFIGAYADFGAAASAAVSEGLDGDYIILMRSDASQTTKSSLGAMTGSLTLDLGGYTLTKGSEGYIFDIYRNNNSAADGDVEQLATYKIINGSVVKAGGNALICINYGALLKKSYSVTIDFEDVIFSSTSGTSVIFQTWENGFSSVGDLKATVTSSFTDCTFDYVNSIDGAVMLNLCHNGKDKTVFDVKINGGKILSDKYVPLATFATADGNENGRADRVTLGKGTDGKYLTEILSQGAIADKSDVWTGEDGTEYVFGTASVNGENVIYSLLPKSISDYKVRTSVSLWSNFVYNIYALKSDNVSAITVNGEAVDTSALECATIDGAEYYLIKVSLPAGESLKDVTLSVSFIDGNSAKWTLSFCKYAKKILEGEYSEVDKTLISDMLSYARAAYVYFGTSDDELSLIESLIGADYDVNNKPDTTVSSKEPESGRGFDKATLVLGEIPSFRFYLSDGFSADDFVFTVGGKTVNTQEGTDDNGDYIEIATYAYRMCDDITYTVKVDGEEYTESYNIYSYLAYASEIGSSELIAIVERLIKYSESALIYRNSVVTE